MSRTRGALRALVAFSLLLSGILPAFAAVDVPPGNRFKQQPAIDMSSIKRTGETKQSFEEKYQRILRVLRRDPGLIRQIKASARRYGIDPIHMIGAIVGEHTYNVGVVDNAQAYYVKALAYLGTKDLVFGYKGESVDAFVSRPQFEDCAKISDNYDLWTCREYVWNKSFRGKTVDGVAFPRDRFSKVFFQPLFAGQTFGLGQINPLTALMVTDRVHRTSGLPLLDPDQAPRSMRRSWTRTPRSTTWRRSSACRSTSIATRPASTSPTIPASPRRSTMSAT